jgi:hypothetical protein
MCTGSGEDVLAQSYGSEEGPSSRDIRHTHISEPVGLKSFIRIHAGWLRSRHAQHCFLPSLRPCSIDVRSLERFICSW